MQNKHKRFTLPQKLIAGVIASGMLATGIGLAFADNDPNGSGGGGSGTGGSGDAGKTSQVVWTYREDFGAPTRDNVYNAMRSHTPGLWIGAAGSDNPDTSVDQAINQANSECQARTHTTCRLVGVGWVQSPGSPASFTGASGSHALQDWLTPWNTDIASKTYSRNGIAYRTDHTFADGSNSLNGLVARELANNVQSKSVVVLVLGNNEPVPPTYDLSITTNQQAPKTLTIGDTTSVRDMIHASNNGSQIREKLTAKVILHAELPQGSYVPSANPVTKTVTISNHGDTASPDFTPSDFGWTFWPEGTYWFDVQVAKQGKMANAVDTADREPAETFKLTSTPPPAPRKTVSEGVSADSMTNTTRIISGTGVGGFEMRFTDTISPNGVAYTVTNMRVTDLTANKDVSEQFTVAWDKAANTVSADRSADKGLMPANHDYEFSFDVTVTTPANYQRVQDEASVAWNHNPAVETESQEFPTWQPNPDKSWVRWDSKTKQWQTVIDPNRTNTTGADTMVFLDGDKVGAVVNGTIPAHLVQAPERIVLTDSYANADYLWDPADVKHMRVFEVTSTTDRHSSVADIINKGHDVTGQWKLSIDKNTHTITAASSKQYATAQQNLPQPKQLTVLAPGVVNFANGKGAAQVRADFGKNPSSELTFCANPSEGANPADTTLTNAGSQTVNNHTVATNEPYICGYVPPVVKDVLAEASQGGDQESVNGKTVYPGQKVEYRLETQPTLPANLGYTVEQVQIRDTFSPYLNPDKQTVEVTDLASGRIISKKQYQTRWDDKAHQFTLTFGKAYVADNWGNGATPRLLVRFEGRVDEHAPASKTIDNQWQLILNNSVTVSNLVSNTPPTPEPHKADKSVKNRSVSIDGKTLLVGEQGVYQLTLDATDKNTAYKVYRLGMVDDFDERYVSILAHDISVVSDTGRDVTDQLNIQVRDGVVYVFAKTVDTEIPATGETAPGDPQPDNLAEYAHASYDPLNDPAIDQSLLGHTYTIDLPYTVIAGGDGTVVENTATQITNNVDKQTETVKNPVKVINPSKDVTVKVNGESIDGQTVYLNSDFLYQLDSSVMPADRAYPEIARWGIDDTLDPAVDQLSGQWAVYANADLYEDGVLVAAKGDKLAGSKFDSTKFGGDLFTAELDPATGKVSIQATDAYLKLVSADATHEQAWRAYIQVKRVKVVEHHENQFTEQVGDQTLNSNIVWTSTPDLTPSLHVEKYDVQTGEVLGDRDDVKDALHMHGDTVKIGFKITNTSPADSHGVGARFKASELNLTDETITGAGKVVNLTYPDGWDTLVLQPGDSVTVTGTLTGVKEGATHTDRAVVTGKPIVPCVASDPDPFDGVESEERAETCDAPEVTSNTDDWSGKRPAPLAVTGASSTGIVLLAAVLLLGGVSMFVIRRPN